MTVAIDQPTLYEQDQNLWLETIIAQLKAGDLHNLDLGNLIEELEGLSGSNKREIETRLIRLIEHLLKRCYVNLPDCYRGWEVTIFSQRDQISRLLKQSPSLKRHFNEVFDDCFETARQKVKIEYTNDFPQTWQFSREIDLMLKSQFWLDENLHH
ncbi:MAG: DUF29 domain-containing protein [Pseudanabaena sp. ELA607]|jgi:hypothetical protein